MKHEVKLLDKYFDDVASGVKTFEIRKNDRNYEVGDTLVLREILGNEMNVIYTGRKITCEVVYVTDFMQIINYVVLGIEVTDVQRKL